MRVFVFEYLTAIGLGRDPADPLHGMYREGRAMRDAVAADFGQVPGCTVLADAAEADRVLVIAPETDGVLLQQVERLDDGRRLNPAPETVALTADKLALADHWRRHGVPTPATTDRRPTACEAFPVVWKPRDGAGSEHTYLLRDGFDVARATAAEPPGPMILQEYVPGRPASVAFLCGPRLDVALPPCWQHLSDDGRLKYRGGELPMPPDLAERALRLAMRAVMGLDGLSGYLGVDLVLGDAPDGSQDSAIEINPRLTTSYVGLRALADFNIAEAMLAVADGQDPPMRWKPGRVRFTPDGEVEHLP